MHRSAVRPGSAVEAWGGDREVGGVVLVDVTDVRDLPSEAVGGREAPESVHRLVDVGGRRRIDGVGDIGAADHVGRSGVQAGGSEGRVFAELRSDAELSESVAVEVAEPCHVIAELAPGEDVGYRQNDLSQQRTVGTREDVDLPRDLSGHGGVGPADCDLVDAIEVDVDVATERLSRHVADAADVVVVEEDARRRLRENGGADQPYQGESETEGASHGASPREDVSAELRPREPPAPVILHGGMDGSLGPSRVGACYPMRHPTDYQGGRGRRRGATGVVEEGRGRGGEGAGHDRSPQGHRGPRPKGRRLNLAGDRQGARVAIRRGSSPGLMVNGAALSESSSLFCSAGCKSMHESTWRVSRRCEGTPALFDLRRVAAIADEREAMRLGRAELGMVTAIREPSPRGPRRSQKQQSAR